MSSKQTKNKAKRPTHSWAKDQDYWGELSVEERAWLAQFNEEFYHGNFDKKRKPIHPQHWRADCHKRHNTMKNDAMAGAVTLEEGITPPPDQEAE